MEINNILNIYQKELIFDIFINKLKLSNIKQGLIKQKLKNRLVGDFEIEIIIVFKLPINKKNKNKINGLILNNSKEKINEISTNILENIKILISNKSIVSLKVCKLFGPSNGIFIKLYQLKEKK